MKKFLIFLLFLPFFASAQNWMASLPAALERGVSENKFVLIGFDPISFSDSSSKKNFTKTKEFRDYAEKNLVLARVRLARSGTSAVGIVYKVSDRKNLAALEKLGLRCGGEFYMVAPNGKWGTFRNYGGKFSAMDFEMQSKRLLNINAPISYLVTVSAKKADYWGEDFKKAFADAKKRKKLVLIGFSSPMGFSGGLLYNSPEFKKYVEKNCECVAVEIIYGPSGFSVPEGRNKIQNDELAVKYLSKTFRSLGASGKIVLLNPENMSAIRLSSVSNFENFQKTAEAFKNGKFEFYGMSENFPFYAVYWDDVKKEALESGKKIIITKEQLNLSNYSDYLKGDKFMGFLYEPCVFRKNEAPLYQSEIFDEFVETPNCVCFYDPAKDEFDIVDFGRLNAYLKKTQ